MSEEEGGREASGPNGASVRARDVMVPLDKYPAVTARDTLARAASVLSEWHIDMQGSVSMPRILLVLSGHEELLGIVRRRDILRGLAPSFLVAEISDHPEKVFDVEVDPNLTELLSGRAAEKLRAKSEVQVAEITLPVSTTLHADDPLIRVIQEMVRRDAALLPVMEDGHVIGVVRTVEVLRVVAEMIAPEPADDADAG